MLQVRNIEKYYGTGGNVTKALDRVSFTVERGEFIAIMGASGSGKTTLLNCISTIDTVSAGAIRLDGQDITRLRPKELAKFRRENLGFIFQDFNLLDTLTIGENIALALTIRRTAPQAIDPQVQAMANTLNIGDILDKYPYQVSGGQKQRAAVARAIITEPKLLLADEPTGALDSGSTDELLRLFAAINRAGQTILMVTHSVKAASRAGRVLFIKDGQVFHQLYRGEDDDTRFYQRISDTLTMLQSGGEPA